MLRRTKKCIESVNPENLDNIICLHHKLSNQSLAESMTKTFLYDVVAEIIFGNVNGYQTTNQDLKNFRAKLIILGRCSHRHRSVACSLCSTNNIFNLYIHIYQKANRFR
jgi:hypothetical protein